MRAFHLAPLALLPVFGLTCAPLQAQQPIGTVSVQDATVAGSLSVTAGRAILIGSSSVVARDHTAVVALNRGGSVHVCATSGLHLTQRQSEGINPLLLAVDRGAVEVRTTALINDVIMTPDLRFTVMTAAPLDLRMRVTRNGDTCVENRGASAPTLGITDQFGESSYQLRAGQHVLFEHGSLKQVVDHESSPCGCPPAVGDVNAPVSDAVLAAGGTPASPAARQAAAQHPFPAAVSQGLQPPPEAPAAVPGAANAQVATTLGYSGDGSGEISGTPTSSSAAASPSDPASSAEKPAPNTLFKRLGRFFKRLFGG